MMLMFLLLIAYLIGSIPTAYLVARFHQMNVFDEGSGSMGTSNIARLLGLQWGLFVFVVDVLKGVVAVGIVISVLSYNPVIISLATAAAICGHSWSIFATIFAYDSNQGIKLRGGKGAATGFGSFFWIAPAYILVAMIAVVIVLLAISRTFSIAAIASWFVGFLWMIFNILNGNLEAIWWLYVLVTTLLVLLRIVGNLQRIFTGTERKLH